MNNPTLKFKYLWKATFKGKTIAQHTPDLYSKHNPKAEWNPSSFRDFVEYFEEHPTELLKFELISPEETFEINLSDQEKPKILCERRGRWGSITNTLLHKEKRPLRNVRIIYYRDMEATVVGAKFVEPRVLGYVIGYQGIDANGNNRQKKISVV